ncbi:alpha/beta hydrolase [Pigmentiphaga sp. NML080357]|jgi:predicted alpha/beta hydrolase|uniref:alpha/beta hydrolase family protein n=1 Tax=Pigmentiphaga sp. NML080357 TaxID=2008675 RepID=UPI000B408122|nr:alpha/beta fold hydrolase [Pigmentiphaga sp. NML080357]OVZ64874.1 alpha/beta hydrolase [Pigmentiphaga sp. NML080357]
MSALPKPPPTGFDLPGAALPVTIPAADGYPLAAFVWRGVDSPALAPRPVVVINAATSVKCRYYFRFAQYLHDNGMDVVAYDYRGIGESRPTRLRGFQASWTDWGALDCEAVLDYAARMWPGRELHLVGHSFGGWAPALARSCPLIGRMVTVGAQFAYWRDYAANVRWRMAIKWHVAMPLLARLCGYFPGRRLGWLEDTPTGVALDWSTPTPRYEDRPSARGAFGAGLPAAQARARILAVSLTDDPFGTVEAIERTLGYFERSERTHLRIAPGQIGRERVGHFAFFHSDYQQSLWPVALAWLQGASREDTGRLLGVPARAWPG